MSDKQTKRRVFPALAGLAAAFTDPQASDWKRDAMCAWMGGSPTPTAADFEAARVTLPGQSEVVRQRLYDYILYPQAGTQQLNFFQNPIGQGISTALGAVVGSVKSEADTNMRLAGQLSSGAGYLVTTIEVQFFAGSSAGANTYIPAVISQFAAAAATTVAAALDDVNKFYQSGVLTFRVLDKVQLQETPLITFPPKNTLSFNSALASNSATVGEVATPFARADGATYEIPGGILLQPNTSFAVNLTWPGLVTMTSGFNGRVGVTLDGWLMRAAQ